MPSTSEHVVLVDEHDREIGRAEKLAAHRQGLLHRAFSVVVWDGEGRQLLQRRAAGKYHSGGLWSNACCGHPRPGEPVETAAARRLREEMGFSVPLERLGLVAYRAEVGNSLIEDEIVHVFRACHEGIVEPDPSEAEDYRWCSLDEIREEVAVAPQRFTVWFLRYVAEEWPVALMPPREKETTVTNGAAPSNESAEALSRIVSEFRADSGTVHFLGDDGLLHLAAATAGMPEPVMAMIRTIPVGKGMAGLAVERGAPVNACNIQTDASGDVRPGAKATGLAGSIVLPIFDGEKVVGALGIANRSERTFDEDEIARLIEAGRKLASLRPRTQ